MKKLVIKTVCITLASLIGAMIIAAGATMLFAPGWVGRQFDGAGNYSASVFFYEKQYEKTGDIADLSVLVLKLDIKNDSAKAEKYYYKLINHEKFDELCLSPSVSGTVIGEKDYYIGNYVYALAKNGKFTDALTFAKGYVDENGYTENNPVRVLIYEYLTKDKVEQLSDMDIALSTITLTNAAEQNYLSVDKTYIENLIKN